LYVRRRKASTIRSQSWSAVRELAAAAVGDDDKNVTLVDDEQGKPTSHKPPL
jgi:hypothetical protein